MTDDFGNYPRSDDVVWMTQEQLEWLAAVHKCPLAPGATPYISGARIVVRDRFFTNPAVGAAVPAPALAPAPAASHPRRGVPQWTDEVS